jgi:hypothetical protein
MPAGMPGGLSKPHARARAALLNETVQEVQEACSRTALDPNGAAVCATGSVLIASKRIMVSRPKTLLRLLYVRSIVDRSRPVFDEAHFSAAIQAEHIRL